MALLSNRSNDFVHRFSPVLIAVLAINHVIGLVGLNLPAFHALFEGLSYINLLVSFAFVILMHRPINNRFGLFVISAFSIGMAIEIAGVNTGFPFGVYHYNGTLGPQIWGVPIVIGLNWVLLSYTCAVFSRSYTHYKWSNVIIASAMMVVVDIFLERFAIRHHFWTWQNLAPPLSNFISWFFVSCLIQVFFTFLKEVQNRVSNWYLLILLLFLMEIGFYLSCFEHFINAHVFRVRRVLHLRAKAGIIESKALIGSIKPVSLK